jgi:outer membrane lipoprotein SlyB|tara:strand:+ start:1096 stop:1563 length:468 start_codon:yes stop_codon:yes gene_type:complete
MIKFLLIISIIFIYSCSSTSPTNVKTSDAQKITAVEYGIIKSSSPIKIKGESNWIGATAGGMIGGLLGTQVCGEEEIIGTKCQDIAVVYGTIGGAAIGTVAQSILGNHDGFQYIVDIDNAEKDSAFVQGDKTPISKGQRVVIIYGKDIRVLPYEE